MTRRKKTDLQPIVKQIEFTVYATLWKAHDYIYINKKGYNQELGKQK